jgi:hypothetical protein
MILLSQDFNNSGKPSNSRDATPVTAGVPQLGRLYNRMDDSIRRDSRSSREFNNNREAWNRGYNMRDTTTGTTATVIAGMPKTDGNSAKVGKPTMEGDASNSRDATAGAPVTSGMPQQWRQ